MLFRKFPKSSSVKEIQYIKERREVEEMKKLMIAYMQNPDNRNCSRELKDIPPDVCY